MEVIECQGTRTHLTHSQPYLDRTRALYAPPPLSRLRRACAHLFLRVREIGEAGTLKRVFFGL